MNGLLLIDKPAGPTSHDVLDSVRRRLGASKGGHAGTLDPQATGLLVLAVGDATRWLEYLPGDKCYQATLRLGLDSDTEDIWGTVREDPGRKPSEVTEEELLEAFSRLKASDTQVPPMVSALKHQGRPLYEWARLGVQVERKARPLEIFALDSIVRRGDDVDFSVHCGSGTYVRSLCSEAGRMLGTGAVLSALRRTRVGPFRVEDAVAPDQAGEARLLGADLALAHLKSYVVPSGREKALCSGQELGLPEGAGQEWAAGGTWRLCGEDGSLLALGSPKRVGGAWRMRPKKVFAAR